MSTTIIMVLVKVTALFLFGWAVAALLRQRAAALRHLVWTACLLCSLLIPVLAFGPGFPVLPDWSETPPAATEQTVAGADVTPTVVEPGPGPAIPPAAVTTPKTSPVVATQPREVPVVASSPEPATSPGFTAFEWLGMLWGLGVLALSVRLLLGCRALARISRRSWAVDSKSVGAELDDVCRDLGVRRAIELRFCESTTGPMTWGVRHPIIALPAEAVEWPSVRLRSVLLHEVAHVARRDAAWQLLARVATIAYWFHPLAWLASRHVHLEQERACDDEVLRAGIKASGYAEDLMGIAATLRPIPAAALVSTAIAGPSELVSRMHYMLDSSRTRGVLTPGRRVGAILGVAIAAVVLGAAQPAQDKQNKMTKRQLATRLIGILDVPTHRDQAIKELAEMGRPAFSALRKAIADKNELVVKGAIAALAKSSAPRIFVDPILLERLSSTSPPKSARVACAKILGPRIDTNDAVFAAFFAILDESGDADLTLEVIHHLSGSQVHRKRVAGRLAKRAAPPRKESRNVVAGEEAFRKEVVRLVNCLESRFLQRSAMKELRAIRTRALPYLLDSIEDPRSSVRSHVLTILCRPRPVNDQVAPAILKVLPKVQPTQRGTLVSHLGACLQRSRASVHDALQYIQKPNAVAADRIIAVLTTLRGSANDVNKVLISLLPEADAAIGKAIVRGFARDVQLGSGREQSIVSALQHKHPEVIVAAIHDILHLTQLAEKVRGEVAALAKHRDETVRTAQGAFLSTLKLRANFQFSGLVVADYSDNRIVELDRNGKEVFTIEEIFGVWDVEKLANGNYLLTEFSVNRISEMTRKGKIVWSFEDLKNPYDADRLPNGNTLIADTFGRRVIEVDRNKKIVWKYDKQIHPYDVDRLPNGNTLIADTHDDRVIEVDKNGKIVWQIRNVPNVHDADRLPNGNTLLTIRMLNEVREVDKNGKTVMSIKNLSSPSDADRLADGTTMVAENGMVRIFSPSGTVLWKKRVTWAVEANALPKSTLR